MNTKINVGGEWLVTLLTCIFVVAKLWGKINWSWWWVFSPLLITAGIAIIILIIWLIFAWWRR